MIIMYDIHLWVADDGAQFESENECMQYEFSQLITEAKEKGMKFWNKDKEEIIPEWGSQDEIYFIYCPEEEAIPIWETIMDEFWPYENCDINRADFYWYNEETNSWTSIKTCREILDTMEKTFSLRG